jgi:hypothetical protein
VKWVTPSAYSLSTLILFPLWLLILGVAWIQLSPPLLAPNINNHPQTAPAAFLSQLFPIRLLILISLLFHQSRFPQQPCCLFTLCWWPFGPSSILLASEHDKIIVNINLPGKLWNASLYWFNSYLSQYEFLKYHGSVILKRPVFCSSMKCPMQCIRYFSYGELWVLVPDSVLQFLVSNLWICLIFITNQQNNIDLNDWSRLENWFFTLLMICSKEGQIKVSCMCASLPLHLNSI